MYQKTKQVSARETMELKKKQRRDKLRDLITSKLRSKYSFGSTDTQTRDAIIIKEVNYFIENEKMTEK